ncbi:PREDICTED: TMV resistance protein N-like [Tarenaya hassleriana]|uniref:TMV resistance protein N-like n=1 Tax=Tarenaya hassleriana TaxID=28532 RepID=UPI0008FD2CC5|nr:PREDICTED: TMV resistance protein N-like [Tarenaya hassleriana]
MSSSASEVGDEISEALVEAIQGSQLSLVVFSEDYASSGWCLEELVQILRCRKTMDQLVIPIFHNVDPSHVRWQKQSFAAAFERHEERYKDNTEKVNMWRSALHEAADLSGHNSSEFKSDSMLVDAIVSDTLEKLRRISRRPNPNNGLVGIDSRMEKVMGLLDFSAEDIRVVGIWGMGGIGKTTLAEAVFDQISGGFEGSYFFRNVRETEEKGDLVERRNECLSVILGENLRIGTSMLPSFVVGRLRRKRVLVVLDDVNHQRQLEILFKGLDESSAGSRVIITTRDKHLLSIFPKDKVKAYDMEGLNDDEALRLFCRNAYVSGLQTEGYGELAMKVVHYASGIPLALIVFACSLRGKGKHEWESALNKLGKVSNLEISKILKVSYDGLEDKEIQNIFLDIACFFKGQDKDHMTRLLDGCYHAASYGLSVLGDKALINLRRNKIEMPDPLQELGWDIVTQECETEPGRRSRLWRPEDVHRLLKRNNGTEAVKGIFLDLSKVMKLNISPDVFEKMYNLRFLKFYNSKGVNTKVCLPCGLESLPDELRYLCWPEFPLKCLPSEFCPENLVELDMRHSNFTQPWSGAQNLCSLKSLNLAYSLELNKLPNLTRATKLERIILRGCCQIDEFPESSTNVKEIDLSRTAIVEVPSSIQHLSRLVDLKLYNCKRLQKLPDTLSSLDKLPHLNLSNCGSLRSIPSGIWKMQSLEVLDLSDCSKLEEIPQVLERNDCLGSIDLSGTAIRELPSSIERLVRLDCLRLDDCRNLSAI